MWISAGAGLHHPMRFACSGFDFAVFRQQSSVLHAWKASIFRFKVGPRIRSRNFSIFLDCFPLLISLAYEVLLLVRMGGQRFVRGSGNVAAGL